MSRRLSHNPKYVLATKDDGRWSGVLSCHEDLLDQPLRWKKPKTIFVCSMSDLFHDKVPWDFIAKVFNVMAATPWHTYQLVTKRPGRMAYFAEHVWPKQGGYWEPVEWTSPSRARVMANWPGTAWPSNVWAGTSVESQKYAPRLDVLARVPAPVRFVSAEPLLEYLDLRPYFFKCSGSCTPTTDDPICACKGLAINWVIVGAESGPKRRPMKVSWVQAIRDHCQATGVALFVKQGSSLWPGKQGQLPDDLWAVKEMPHAQAKDN